MTKTRIQLFLAALVLMATCLSVYAFTEVPDGTESNVSPNSKEGLIKGEGSYSDGTTTWDFSVNAAVQNNGTIKGNLTWNKDNVSRSITIDCLKFDGAIVYVSGKDSAARPVTFVLYDSWESKRADLI